MSLRYSERLVMRFGPRRILIAGMSLGALGLAWFAQVGGALGLAVLATVASTHSHGLIRHGVSTASALTAGYHVAFWIGAGLVAVAIAVAGFVLEGGPALAPHGVRAGEPELGDELAARLCTEVG